MGTGMGGWGWWWPCGSSSSTKIERINFLNRCISKLNRFFRSQGNAAEH